MKVDKYEKKKKLVKIIDLCESTGIGTHEILNLL